MLKTSAGNNFPEERKNPSRISGMEQMKHCRAIFKIIIVAVLISARPLSLPALENSADIQSGEITENLVACPMAAAEVRRALPVISGRDFVFFLSDRFHLMQGVSGEEFIRRAGWLFDTDLVRDGKFSCSDYRQEKPARKVAIGEIEIYQGDEDSNAALKSKFLISSDEKTTVIDGIGNLNDGSKATFAFIIGDPRNALKRYQGVHFEIKAVLPDPAPVSLIKLRAGCDGAYGLEDVTFLGEDGGVIKPISCQVEGGVVVAKFVNAPASRSVTLKCLSPSAKVAMKLSHPEAVGVYSNSPGPVIIEHGPLRMNTGYMLGLEPGNMDMDSMRRLAAMFGDNLVGFEMGEYDSNFYQIRAMKGNYNRPDLAKYVPLYDDDKFDAEQNLRLNFEMQKGFCPEEMKPFGHSGGLKSAQYGYEWGGEAAVTQFASERTTLNKRQLLMFTRGGARQYGMKPWIMHLAQEVGGASVKATPNSLVKRTIYYTYYQGAFGFKSENWPDNAVDKVDADTWKLNKQGEMIRSAHESLEKPEIKRGELYTPVLLLVDYFHGHFEYRRDKEWLQWRVLPFEDGNYMLEHFLQTIAPTVEEAGSSPQEVILDPKREHTLWNSKHAAIYDVFFANPPSGVVTPEELGKYPAVVLAGDIRISPELATNLTQYVRAGGTLLINSAQADIFKDDTEFLGVKMLAGHKTANNTKIREIELAGARTVLKGPDGDILMTKKTYGKGNVLFATPRFMLVEGDKKTTSKLIDKIMTKIHDEVLPVKVEGDVLCLFNRMPDGSWKLVLINNKGSSKNITAKNVNYLQDFDEEKLLPEFDAGVRITAAPGVTAEEVFHKLPVIRDGDVISLKVPAGDLCVVNLKGINFSAPPVNQDKPAPRFVRETNLNQGLLAEWKFDEGSGEVALDTSGNRNAGKLYKPEYVKTKTGFALKFGKEGTWGYCNAKIPLLPLREGTYVLWASMDPDENKGTHHVLSGTYSTPWITANGGFWGVTLPVVPGRIALNGPKAVKNKWTQLVLTWKDFTAKFYVDGREIKRPEGPLAYQFPSLGNNIWGNTDAYIGTYGHNSGSALNFNGLIDEIRLYGNSFTDGMVAEAYEREKSIR